MLKVYMPKGFFQERSYIIEVILNIFLDLRFILLEHTLPSYIIELENGNQLEIRDAFFSRFSESVGYLHKENIPASLKYMVTPLGLFLPIIYGDDEFSRIKKGSCERVVLGLDIFASSYFMLSRWEDYILRQFADKQKRVAGNHVLSIKEGFYDRPIVNEYLELLKHILISLGLCGGLFKKRSHQVLSSHDIDRPFKYYRSNGKRLVRDIGSEIFRGGSLKAIVAEPYNYLKYNMLSFEKDPYYTFDKILRTLNELGLSSVFYFIMQKCSSVIDGMYDIQSPWGRQLLKTLLDNGQQIGVHGSLKSSASKEVMRHEINILKDMFVSLNVHNAVLHNRQHYLKVDMLNTYRELDSFGVNVDSSLMYPGYCGFRTGTCYTYPIFDFKQRRKLNINESPLVVMDASLINLRDTSDGSLNEAFLKAAALKNECKKYDGDFGLLWHNTFFINDSHCELFRSIVSC